MRITPFFLFVFLLSSVQAGAQENLGGDLNQQFFNKKKDLFSHWLDKKGIGEVLKVDKFELKKNDMELELFLSVRSFDHDSVIAMWNNLERTFPQANNNMPLEEALYSTYTRMFEIHPEQGNIQIYFPRKDVQGTYNPCFYVWIWKENGAVQTKKRINNCKAQRLEIVVKPPKVMSVSSQNVSNISRKEEAYEVFEAIYDYAKSRYEQPKCKDRNPRVEDKKISSYSLTFTVSDLCREVLTDESESIWCRFVQLWWGDCNDMRRERLEFTFNYIPTDEGYTLTGSLTGKFGSGVYRPRISGYMDMEPDFEKDFLIPYVTNFQNDLKAYLETRRP